MKTTTWIALFLLVFGTSAVAQDAAGVDQSAAAGVESQAGAQGAAAASQGAAASGDAATQLDSGSLEGASEVHAVLESRLDARRARPGDEVTATLTEDVATEGEVVVPRGSKLVGRVTEAERRGGLFSRNRADSRLGVLFERAVLEDGREVPVHVAIQALAAAETAASLGREGMAREQAPLAGSPRGSSAGSGAGNALGRGTGTAGGLVGGAAGAAGGLAAGASGTADTAVRGVGSAGGALGASGALQSETALAAGSRGVFGLPGVEIAAASTAGAEGSVIASTSRDVLLESGTQLLLSVEAGAAVR